MTKSLSCFENLLLIFIIAAVLYVSQCHAKTERAIEADNPRDVIAFMLDAQKQLVGYTANGYVNMRLGKLKLPRIAVQMTVKRPANIELKYLGLDIKPKYPLLPDPASLSGNDYDLKWSQIKESDFYVIDALPRRTAPCPFKMTLWVEKRTNLLMKARLIHGESYTDVEAEYRNMGDNCWVPERLTGNGGLLVGELLPLPPVKAAIKLFDSQDTISYTASFSSIKLSVK